MLVAMAELQRLMLTEIRTHDGCEDVTDVSIYRVTDDQAESNWSVWWVAEVPLPTPQTAPPLTPKSR
jgi:hypothetical protein